MSFIVPPLRPLTPSEIDILNRRADADPVEVKMLDWVQAGARDYLTIRVPEGSDGGICHRMRDTDWPRRGPLRRLLDWLTAFARRKS